MPSTLRTVERRVARLVRRQWPWGAAAAAGVAALAFALPLAWPGGYRAEFVLRCETGDGALRGRELVERLDTPALRRDVAEAARTEPAFVERALSIKAVGGRTVHVTCASRDEDDCGAVARAALKELEKTHILPGIRLPAGREAAFDALSEWREKAAEARRRLDAFEGTYRTEEDLAPLRERLAAARAAEAGARVETARLESQIARLEAEPAALGSAPAAEPDPGRVREGRALEEAKRKAEEDLATLRAYATKQHPLVRKLEERLEAAEAALAAHRATTEGTDPKAEAAARLAAAREALSAARSAREQAASALAEVERSCENAAGSVETCGKLRAKLAEAEAEVAKRAAALPEGAEKTFRVEITLESGDPYAQYRPGPLALGPAAWGLIALAAAVVAMLAGRHAAGEVRTKRDLAAALGLPVLGELPRLARTR